MTITSLPNRTPLAVERADLEEVTFDLYRYIHKGIRHELFGVTEAIGSVDPGDDVAVEATVARLQNLVALLISHAEHEDEFVQPVIEAEVPALAAVIAEAHPRLECEMGSLEVLADRAVNAARAQRRNFVHMLYLGVASFTGEYLAHQAFEEVEVAPALFAAVGPEKLIEIDHAIVATIPPDQMGVALSMMLPAMNIDDRSELLGGIRAGAPVEVFAQVMGLAQTVLQVNDYEALAARLAA
jgi:hypothetical protein